MSLLAKAILELLRVLVLSGLFLGTVNYLVKRLEKIYVINLPEWALVIINVVFLIIFFLWYRLKGQYKGWYPVTKKIK